MVSLKIFSAVPSCRANRDYREGDLHVRMSTQRERYISVGCRRFVVLGGGLGHPKGRATRPSVGPKGEWCFAPVGVFIVFFKGIHSFLLRAFIVFDSACALVHRKVPELCAVF